MPDEALTLFSFLPPNNHVLLLPPLLETRICIVFSFLCVNKHYKKIIISWLLFHSCSIRLNHYNASCSCILSVVSYTCCFMSYASCFASHASWPIIMPADSLHASCSMHLFSCRMDQGRCFIYNVSCLMCHISYLMYYANRLMYFANCSIIRSSVSSIMPGLFHVSCQLSHLA
jgi:hypothetical protein